jgi:hypothetical protein
MNVQTIKKILNEQISPFGQAYRNARQSGIATFMYNGKKYSSELNTRPIINTSPKTIKEPIMHKDNKDNEKAFRPKITAYSPQKSGTSSHSLEGGYSSARPGPDQNVKDWKTWKVRSIEDYNSDDPKSYVTLAGHPSQYGKKYTIPSLKYINTDGTEKELKNVRGYVHDTGKAFKGKDAEAGQRFDIAMGKDWKSDHLNRQPWSMKNDVDFKHGWDEKPENIKVVFNKTEYD